MTIDIDIDRILTTLSKQIDVILSLAKWQKNSKSESGALKTKALLFVALCSWQIFTLGLKFDSALPTDSLFIWLLLFTTLATVDNDEE